MAYVPVPKDLSKVKTKVAFNLTKRQIVCFAAALLFGLPLFFLLKDSTGTNLKLLGNCFPSPCRRFSRICFYSLPCQFRVLRLLWKLRYHMGYSVSSLLRNTNGGMRFPHQREENRSPAEAL